MHLKTPLILLRHSTWYLNDTLPSYSDLISVNVLQARNYYQIIKRPIDLSVIRRKLDKSNTLHYFTAEQFVDDILLMFKNCATFNYVSLPQEI